MRATLWQGDGAASEIVREILRGLCVLANIHFDVVLTQQDLLAAAATSRRSVDRHILLIDCFYGEPGCMDRCAGVVTGTTLTIYIVHPREDAIRDLSEIAGRSLGWFPSNATIDILLDKLHMLRALAAADTAGAVARPALTPRQREVAELLADGRTNSEIAGALRIAKATAKTHVQTILQE